MQVSNNTMVNFEALANALKGISAEDLAAQNVKDVAITTDAGGLTITFNAVVDGKDVPIVLAMTPELDAPAGASDPVVMEDLIAKLDTVDVKGMTEAEAKEFVQELLGKLTEKIAAQGGLKTTQIPSSKGTTGSATLFNLLEILTLLVEVGQEIKKAAKTIKAADNEMQALSYERQAEATMAMAEAAKSESNKYLMISIGLMVCSAAVSIGAGVYGATKAALAETKSADNQASMANTIKNVEVSSESINTVTTKAGVKAASQIPEARLNEIKASFSENHDINVAKTEVATAQADITAASTDLASAKQDLSNLQTAKAALEEQMENMPLDAPEQDRNALQQAIDNKTQQIGDAQTRVDAAQTRLDAANERLDTAKTKFQDAVTNVMNKYSSAYTGASKADQNTKLAELTVANEIGLKTLKGATAAPGGQTIMTDVDFGKVVTRANANYRAAMGAESHWKLQAASQFGQFLGQTGTILSQHWQSKVSYQAQSDAAKAQQLQAEATRKQTDYDEDKSLEDSGQQIINAAQQTMSKVYEGEHETSRQIFS